MLLFFRSSSRAVSSGAVPLFCPNVLPAPLSALNKCKTQGTGRELNMNSSSFPRQTVCQQDVSSAARSKRLQKQLEKELQEAGEGSRTRVPPRLRTTLPTASRVKVPGHIQTFVKVVLLVLKQNNPQPCHTCQFVALWHICILSQRMWPPVDAALDHQHPAVAAERTT